MIVPAHIQKPMLRVYTNNTFSTTFGSLVPVKGLKTSIVIGASDNENSPGKTTSIHSPRFSAYGMGIVNSTNALVIVEVDLSAKLPPHLL